MQFDQSFNKQFSNYDEVFLEHYDSVFRWALQITKHDRELAEDLVQEVYLHFNVTRQNPAAVSSVDNYLYVSLRNSYISYLRKVVRLKSKQLSVIEYDLVDNALLAVDPRQQIQIHERLRAVCQYACLRKVTSISGSVLILRFFHGYFPSEVARVLNCSINVVEARLVSARREAAAFLNNPSSLSLNLSNSISPPPASPKNYAQRHYDLLKDLRAEIFKARQGECFSPNQVEAFYRSNEPRLRRCVLSHIVSCHHCLDEINKSLGLPLLWERHPLDTLGREQPDKEINHAFQVRELFRTATL